MLDLQDEPSIVVVLQAKNLYAASLEKQYIR